MPTNGLFTGIEVGIPTSHPLGAVSFDYAIGRISTLMESRLPDIISSTAKPKAGACVFFSRALLDRYSQDPQVVALRLYVVGFGAQVVGVTPNLSLVSVGVNSAGQPVGPFLLSEEPCPPNCPMGYP